MIRLTRDDDEFVFDQMLRWGSSPLQSFFSDDHLHGFTARMVGPSDFFGLLGQASDSKTNHDQLGENSSKRRFFSSCTSSSSWMTRDADGNLVAQDVTRYRDSNGADAEKKVRRVGDITPTVMLGNDEGQRHIESFNRPGHGSNEHKLLQPDRSIDTAVQDDAVANEANGSKEDASEKILTSPTTPPSATAAEQTETEETKKPPRKKQEVEENCII